MWALNQNKRLQHVPTVPGHFVRRPCVRWIFVPRHFVPLSNRPATFRRVEASFMTLTSKFSWSNWDQYRKYNKKFNLTWPITITRFSLCWGLLHAAQLNFSWFVLNFLTHPSTYILENRPTNFVNFFSRFLIFHLSLLYLAP